jgi:hypothetical protein
MQRVSGVEFCSFLWLGNQESPLRKKNQLWRREREREKFNLIFGDLQKNSNLLFGFHLQEDDDDDIQIQIRACFVGSVLLQGRDSMMHPEADAHRSGPQFGIPVCIHSI